jgi:hypothetical protein
MRTAVAAVMAIIAGMFSLVNVMEEYRTQSVGMFLNISYH